MNGELKRLALWMIVPDELKKYTQSFFSISTPLKALVDKKVEDPVVVEAAWFKYKHFYLFPLVDNTLLPKERASLQYTIYFSRNP
jgi:hypothetical protein